MSVSTAWPWSGSGRAASKHDLDVAVALIVSKIEQLRKDNMAKLNDLEGILAMQNTKLDAILTDVQALVAAGGGNPDLPAGAQANLDAQGTKIQAIQDVLHPPQP